MRICSFRTLKIVKFSLFYPQTALSKKTIKGKFSVRGNFFPLECLEGETTSIGIKFSHKSKISQNKFSPKSYQCSFGCWFECTTILWLFLRPVHENKLFFSSKFSRAWNFKQKPMRMKEFFFIQSFFYFFVVNFHSQKLNEKQMKWTSLMRLSYTITLKQQKKGFFFHCVRLLWKMRRKGNIKRRTHTWGLIRETIEEKTKMSRNK